MGGCPSKMSALRVNRRAAGSPACVAVEREAEAAFPSTARLCACCLGARPAGLEAAFSGTTLTVWTQAQMSPGRVRSEPGGNME